MLNRDATLRLAWVLLSLICLGWYFSKSYDPPVAGDGQEYYLMTESLLHHGSPELRDSDLQRAAALPDTKKIASNAKWIQTIRSGTAVQTWGTGYFKSRNGSYFSWHFWLYPLANVPAMALCDVAALSPTTAFVITNCLALLAAVIFALFFCGYSARKTAFTVAVILFSGAYYFASWMDPATFCVALLFIGLMCCDTGRPLAGALMFALAAQQNPPIGILAAAALAWSTWERLHSKADRRSTLSYGCRVGVVVCVLFLSPLFYLWAFGQPSLIASRAHNATDLSLITLQRLQSIFFDPNQSVLVQVPAVFVILPLAYLLVIAFRRFTARQYVWSAALLLSSPVIALPALATTDWHAGLERYASWVAVP